MSVDDSNVDKEDACSALNVTPDYLNEDSPNTVAAIFPELDLEPPDTEAAKDMIKNLEGTVMSIRTDLRTTQETPFLEENPLHPGTFSIGEENVSQESGKVENGLESCDGNGYSSVMVCEDEYSSDDLIQ